MRSINDQDWQVFEFIEKFIMENRYSPSTREIIQATSLSAARMVKALRKLRNVGAIDYQDNKARTIVVLRYSLTEKGLAAAGQVASR